MIVSVSSACSISVISVIASSKAVAVMPPASMSVTSIGGYIVCSALHRLEEATTPGQDISTEGFAVDVATTAGTAVVEFGTVVSVNDGLLTTEGTTAGVDVIAPGQDIATFIEMDGTTAGIEDTVFGTVVCVHVALPSVDILGTIDVVVVVGTVVSV